MKLSKELLEGLNEQVSREFEAAHLYKAMQIYLDSQGVYGMKKWMSIQVDEERSHAQDFIDFIHESDEDVKLRELKLEVNEFTSFIDVFEKSLEHEKFITKSINDLLEIAIKDKNYAAENFLRTYVDEQVEEEDNFRNMLNMLKFAGDDRAALFHVDSIMGRREA